MLKLISWNIDSLNAALTSASPRAQLSRDVLDTIKNENADIIAIQETKLSSAGPAKKHLEALAGYFPGYHVEWISSEPPARKGYAGTMVLYREEMKFEKLVPRIGAPDTMDDEGRLLVLECGDYYFVNVYTPNAGDGLKRLPERQEWDKCYADYLAGLDQQKPVIACGDFNVAHREIDLAHPASNHMSAGFTDEEREKFSDLLACGFTDSFRYKYPEEVKYSWWSYRFQARQKNVGWRIDYFVISDRLRERLDDAKIHSDILGSDHCPIELDLR